MTKQGPPSLLTETSAHRLERLVEAGLRRGVARSNHALRDDRGEVSIFKLDLVEPTIPVAERRLETQHLDAGELIADHLRDVALARDVAHDWDLASFVLCLDQLRELLDLHRDPVLVAGATRQPEDELVEEEHDRVVSESGSMPRHAPEPDVEAHKARAALRERREVGLYERGQEAIAFLALG